MRPTDPDETPDRTPTPGPLDSFHTVGKSPSKVFDRAARTPTNDSPPVDVPGFVVERVLGRGGMGVVYLARQIGLERPVALKMVLSAADRNAIIRFLAESQAVAAIRHEYVVEVYQYGEANGQPFLALEYCSGGSLADRLPHGADAPTQSPFSPTEAAELVAKIAAGVEAAHALGIVHRDLKPHNVLLTADGTPKVTDFGLAKFAAGANLTLSGQEMGTPAYMPPEQARGGAKFVGPEADVWALGVILYELLTGRRPFVGDSKVAILIAVELGDYAPPRSVNSAVPRDLEWIVRKCLSHDPRDRYPTAGALAADLQDWRDGKPIVARPAGRIETAAMWVRRNRTVASATAAVVLALLMGTVVSVGFGIEASNQADLARGAAKTADKERTEAKRQERFATEKADLAISEEKRADRERDEAKRQENIAKDAKTQADKERVEAQRQERLAKDAKTQADAATQQVKAQLKESRRLLDLSRLRDPRAALDSHQVEFALGSLNAIDPDNRCIVWGLFNRRCEGGLFTLYGHTEAVWSVALSADGRRVVTGSEDNTARVWDAATGQALATLTGHTREVTSVAMSADGRRVVTGSEDNTARVWDTATGQSLATLKGHTGGVRRVALSADRRRVMTGDTKGITRVWDAMTGQHLQNSLFPTTITPGVTPRDGRLVIASGNQVLLVDPRISDEELLRRRVWMRPDPGWHVRQQAEAEEEKNPYAVAVHRSLESRARGVLAHEAGDVNLARALFIQAALQWPKPSP